MQLPSWLISIVFCRVGLCLPDSSRNIVMTLLMCMYSPCRLGRLLMWPQAKKDRHATSQIKAVIVTLTTTEANERHIGYRNKHFGDTSGARLQWECGHRPWVTQSPHGRPSTGRNLGMGQGACRTLVLKTNLGPVIHKSLVYQCLETLVCTFHQSRATALSLGYEVLQMANMFIGPNAVNWLFLQDDQFTCDPKGPQIYNTVLLFLPVLNRADNLTSVTVSRTLSILRPCSEKHLYLALVTAGSVFSSAWWVFL